MIHIVIMRQLMPEDQRAGARIVDADARRIAADAHHAQPARMRIDGHVGMAAAVTGRRRPTIDMPRAGITAGAKHPTKDILLKPQLVEGADERMLSVGI